MEGGHREGSMMRDAAAGGVVYDVDEGGLWCMEGGHREVYAACGGGL